MRIRYGSEKEKRGGEKDGERKRQSRRGGDIGGDLVQRRRSGDRNEERKNGVEGRGREREKLKREPKVEGKREGSK